MLPHFLYINKNFATKVWATNTHQYLPVKGGQLQLTPSIQDITQNCISMLKPALIVNHYFHVLALI
jgi:hypothetical protein